MIKNTTGQKIGAQLVSATDGSAFTGAVTVAVTGDAGTQATGSVGAGACAHEGNGYHTYAPAQAETNYDLVAFSFTGSGAVPVTVQVYTNAGDAFTRLGAPAGASVSADILVIDNFVDDLETRLSATRAGYLDNLSAGAAALEATAQAVLTDTVEIGTAGAGLTNINLPNQTMDIVGNITGNLSGSVGSVTGAVGSVAGAVGSVTGAVGSVTGAVGSIGTDGVTAASLAADAATEIATAVFARAFAASAGSHTFDELVKMIASVLLGKASGLATTSAIYRNLADTANVVTATVDADGNRTAVTRNP